MDAISDPLVETVVLMFSSQSGKTEIELNTLGYYIGYDACPILVVLPTLDMAQAWSKDRLAPMLRDTPTLQGKVKDVKSRFSDNTVLHKKYPGGHVTLCGANSPSSLSSRPIRVVLYDEVDRFPPSAGTEGDPVSLARKRTETFWNRKLVLVSTPTVKNASRIEAAYKETDQRQFFVPCPHCGGFQTLRWSQVQWPDGEPEKAAYYCEHCGAEINDNDKLRMIRLGEWRASQPFKGAAGFHLNALYSPWTRFGRLASSFLEAKRSGDQEQIKAFVNTVLAETWEEQGESADEHELMGRLENFGEIVPSPAKVLTVGVDVQDDRIEAEIVAWGEDYESWSIDYRVIWGSPGLPEVWADLDAMLLETWKSEDGRNLRVAAAGVDTGGHHTQEAYNFCSPRQKRRVFAFKGSNQSQQPIVPRRPSKAGRQKVNLYQVGTDTAKARVMGWLKVASPGPGYCHFPAGREQDYFHQLTAEQLVTRYHKGFPKKEWVKKSDNRRNEALDCRVYALAAFELIGGARAVKAMMGTPQKKTKERPQSTNPYTGGVNPFAR